MTEGILRTKLFIPPLRPNLVHRPQLIKRLNQGLQLGHKLSLVSAPAGFGKTTLVCEWIGGFRPDAPNKSETINSVSWLSLDESDNDLTRFLAYIVAALNQVDGTETTIGRGALSMLRSLQPPPAADFLTSIVNDVVAIPGRIILVLDDFHLIDSSPVIDAVTFLLENLPPQLHIVITTRDDPQVPLARFRARGQLTELRAADLRFSISEAAEFLNQVMDLDLPAQAISVLEARTEGWIAGLQLAAISMQGRQDTTSLIKSFTGSHRFILDYLIEEVLEQQTEGIQKFLLQTSIADRLTGDMCDTITGQDNGQVTLEMLEKANLFIIPLDDERHWYRYHRLFSDLLQQRLRQMHPERVLMLHHRASEWNEQNGFADEAIEHALRAKDFERAGSLIEEWSDATWQRGEHAKMRRWLLKLPSELVFSRPHLGVYHAWYLFASGQHAPAERSLQAVEEAICVKTDGDGETESQKLDKLSSSERVRLQGMTVAIRAFMSSYQGDVAGIIEYANLALEYLPEQDATWRSMIAIVLGDAHGFKGDINASFEVRSEALRVCRAAGNIYYVMLASMKLAITLRSQGKLRQTMEICEQQIQVANEYGLSQTSLVGLLLMIWGEVLAEINDLDGALRQANKGVDLTEGVVDLAFLGWGYMSRLRILFSRGDLVGVDEILKKVESIARVSNLPPWIVNQMKAWQARIWLAQSNLELASRWAEQRQFDSNLEVKPSQEIDYFLLIDYLVYARTLLAKGRIEEAAKLLEQILEAAEMGGRISKAIEIRILQALAFQAGNEPDRALSALERAFALAEPEGFVRIFVDEGPPMARLLQEALNRGIVPDYARRLLAAFSSADPVQTNAQKSLLDQSGLVEPLSEREIEVLQLIAEGLTNREIAERLYISLSTVKVHTRNIYGKLSVHSRTQAVARSQELGILSNRPN
ncbi:MAG TPA: LuxR C-terminal-related transcriptional regulator [candidate division Zixibacteria bacterium]|nr:LuxR C-terminal-related transcriptional regulator [candidate division Zixibacteria bacterium]